MSDRAFHWTAVCICLRTLSARRTTHEKCSGVKAAGRLLHANVSIPKVEGKKRQAKKDRQKPRVNLQLIKLMKSGQLISISL